MTGRAPPAAPPLPLEPTRRIDYICLAGPGRPAGKGRPMTDRGLQKVAFFVLIGLILYVAIAGGG